MFGEFKTLREHLGDPRRRPATFEGIAPDAALDMMVVQYVHEWSAEPFDEGGACTWPVAGVPVPASYNDGDTSYYYSGSFLAGDYVFVLHDAYTFRGGAGRKVVAYQRTPAADYWPTEDVCRASVHAWAAAFLADMLPRVGTDCDEHGPNVTPAGHWRGAKRRYGLKDNQTCRLLYLARLDPEARHRRNPWLPLPKHVELWLGVADYLCGKLAGVEDVQAEDLVMSGGVLDECAVLAFAKAHCA